MNALKRNNVKVYGTGQPILFAHGYGSDQNLWRFVAPTFQKNHQVILFDHAGCGNSDRSSYRAEDYTSLKDYADDLLEICSELNLKKVVYVGHSVSGMIGVLASTASPETFQKLGLIGPSPCYLNEKDYRGGFTLEDIEGILDAVKNNLIDWSRTTVPAFMNQNDSESDVQQLVQSFCRMDPEVATSFARATFLSDYRSEIEKIKIPTLILQTASDPIAPGSVGKFLHEHIHGSILKHLSVTGHYPQISGPSEVIEYLKSFINSDD